MLRFEGCKSPYNGRSGFQIPTSTFFLTGYLGFSPQVFRLAHLRSNTGNISDLKGAR